jgi:hypothetical protein
MAARCTSAVSVCLETMSATSELDVERSEETVRGSVALRGAPSESRRRFVGLTDEQATVG